MEFGPHKGYYGIVENLSGNESIYVTVKLRLMNDSVQLLQDFVRIVTKQEYDSESKVINKNRYDEYMKQRDNSNQRNRSKSRSHVCSSIHYNFFFF